MNLNPAMSPSFFLHNTYHILIVARIMRVNLLPAAIQQGQDNYVSWILWLIHYLLDSKSVVELSVTD